METANTFRFDPQIIHGKVCPYCAQPSVLMDSAPFYNGRSYGLVYACVDCDAYVGVHRGTETAKGRLADAELRRWKIKAHSSFDALWRRAIDKGRTKHEARTSAYKWLSLELGLPPEHTHIGMFDIDLCKQVVKTCRQYL